METVNTGWLKNNDGEKFAPRTLTSQIVTDNGKTLDVMVADVKSNINSLSESVVYMDEYDDSVDVNTTTMNTGTTTGSNGIYIGSGEMPDGYNVQIDPEGSASEVVTREEFENIKVYVVDQGSNDKGHYRKWSDGTLDMWGRSVYTDAIITNQTGSLFYSAIIQLNLPMASLTPVVVNVSAVSSNLVWCYVGSSGDMLNNVQIRLVAPSALEKNSGTLTYHYFGTWK